MASRKPKVLGVIPARLHSTRLPRKMLADIGGKPLVYYTWRQAKKARLLDEVVVATDSKEIVAAVESFGGRASLTSPRHKTGSDRVAEAAKKFKDFNPDIVVNIQGDQPTASPGAINQTVRGLLEDGSAPMSTVATPLSNLKELHNPGFVKVVVDHHKRALYFSRSPIPYPRTPYKDYLWHLGLYAFRRDFLFTYVKLKQTRLEIAESLEQLRALENGYPIAVRMTKFEGAEVNVKSELDIVRKLLVR